MKIPSLFTKTPPHRKFSYEPRFYNQELEERKEREERIRKELEAQGADSTIPIANYQSRISGSFKSAKRTASRQHDPSAGLIRLIIVTFLAIWLIAFLQFGNVAFYALLLFIPFYFLLKFRSMKR
jgi:Flp pilus assembly protein TadB